VKKKQKSTGGKIVKKYKMIEIKSISKKPFCGIVHDLTVKDDHSYAVGDGIIVHNSACQTRRNTGVGVPQFSLLEDIFALTPEYIPIISDGGIKHTGDISKAMIFANAVMVARMIAGTSETPGCVYEDENGQFYKKFGGSASGEHKVSSGGRNKFVEGHMTNVPFRGKVKYILDKIREGLQSAMSYSGASNMAEYKEKVIYGEMSSGGVSESKLN
jgi:IMP dehydrogenase